MLESQNLFNQPTVEVQIDTQFQKQLRDIQMNAKATRMYLFRMLRVSFNNIRFDTQQRYLFLKFYFEKICQNSINGKIQKLQMFRMSQFFNKIRLILEDKMRNRAHLKQICQKLNKNKQKRIFSSWKQTLLLQNKAKQLQNKRRQQLSKQLLDFLTQNKRCHQLKKLEICSQNFNSHSIYSIALMRKAFDCFVLNQKYEKTRKIVRKSMFIQFIYQMKKYNKNIKQKYQNYRKNQVKRTIFQNWKMQYQQNKALVFWTIKAKYKYFQFWKNNLQLLISQKHIQQNNECIINIFIQRSQNKLVTNIFNRWKQFSRDRRQNRYHSSVLNKYADIKSKSTLLSKYFQKLKLNYINNQIKYRFCDVKLKRKAIEGFKISICQSIQKEQNIIKFMQKRQIAKYFKNILKFNKQQKLQTDTHRLKHLFKQFSFTIVYQYYKKQKIAIQYQSKNLLFKSWYILKKQVNHRHLQEQVIAYVNIRAPLRRWNIRYRINKYIQNKKWMRLKQVMRRWRLMVIRRESQKKIVKQFKQFDSNRKSSLNDSKLEAFQFQNIMSTIAKIKNNFLAEKLETVGNHHSSQWPAINTPSQSVNFSYSVEDQ